MELRNNSPAGVSSDEAIWAAVVTVMSV
jgi:hypothetical protein